MMRVMMGVAAAGLLAACQTQGAPAPAGLEPVGEQAAGVPAGVVMFDPPAGPLGEGEIWRVEPGDVVAHIQSGATCPALRGDLRRDKQTIYRANGMDVGCNYTGISTPTAMRFYVFTSATGGLDAEMKVASDSMRAQQPIAKRAPPSPASQAFRNYALVEADANGVMMRSSLMMTQVNGGWMLKIRLTCREEDAIKAEELAAHVLSEEAERLKSRPVPRVTLAAAAPG